MSMFSGMGSAKREISSNWLNKAGRYICRIDECNTFTSPKDNKDYFKSTLTVLHVIDNGGGLGHRVGETASWSVCRQGFKFLEKVKNFVLTATEQTDEEAVDEAVMTAVTGPDQALAGYCLEVTVRLVPTKESTPEDPKMSPRTTWLRAVPLDEVKKLLKPDEMKKLYPQGL